MQRKESTTVATDLPGTQEAKRKLFLIQKVALFLVAFLIYANSIGNGFNMDDEFYTTGSNVIANKGLSAIGEIFTTHTFHDAGNDYEYRPVTMLTFVIQHQFIGGSPAVSHFINVLLYALACLVIFIVLRKWFGEARTWLAFFSCVLFAVHPLHTEVVNSIKSRDEILSLLLGFWSLSLIWKWVETKKVKWIFISQAVFLLAMLSKVTIIPFTLVFPIAFYFFTDMPLKKVFYFFLVAFATYTLFWLLSNVALPPTVRDFYEHENPLYTASVGLLTRYATVLYVMGWYLYLHIVPHPLVFFYGYKYVPLVSFANVWVWLSLLVHIVLVVAIINEIRRKSLFAFGGIFYFLNIFVFSNLLIPAPGIMAERFVFAASLGFCIMACILIYRLLKVPLEGFSFSMTQGKVLAGLLLAVCLVYSVMTISRNPDWKNRETLYGHDIEYLENSAKANMLYGEYMMRQEHVYREKAATVQIAVLRKNYTDSARHYHDIAKKALLKALEISPDYGNAINNVAVMYFQEDSIIKARHYLLKAQQITPGNIDIAYNIGIIYSREGKLDSALRQFQKAISIDKGYLPAYKAISDMQLMVKDTNAAILTLQEAADSNPRKAAPYGEMANIAMMRKDTLQAIAYCEKAAESDAVPVTILSFLAEQHTMRGNTSKADYYRQKIAAAQAKANE